MMWWAWMNVHWVFGALLLFAFVAALLWLYKHGSKNGFLSVVSWSMGIGIVGVLLTAPMAGQGFATMMNMMGNNRGFDQDTMEDMLDYMDDEWQELEEEYGEDVGREEMMDHMRDSMMDDFWDEEDEDDSAEEDVSSEPVESNV